MNKKYASFREFYPFYLSEHSNQTCRRLHFVGTTLALVLVVTAVLKGALALLLAALITGYAFAWAGHFFFEKNRPATFIYPFYSFIGDWVMWKDILTGRIKF